MEKKQTETKRELTLEESFDRLEAMIGRLEERETSLEESIQIYQEGMKLLKKCGEKIDLTEKKVLKTDEEGELDEF